MAYSPEMARSRTSEGRERAKANGVVMGRKPKLTHHQRQEAIARRGAGEPLVEIGRSYNVSHSTISRL
jgi:DNA invertase Pin-like site-specific DNA recombinase